jgi:epoxyqueuosine reductase
MLGRSFWAIGLLKDFQGKFNQEPRGVLWEFKFSLKERHKIYKPLAQLRMAHSMDPLEEIIRKKALMLGFLRVGFTSPDPPPYLWAFEEYLSRGYHGQMWWLKERAPLRRDPRLLLEGVQTIIVLAYPYPQYKLSTPEGLEVSRFANPMLPDYHKRIKGLLNSLVEEIKAFYPKERFRSFVDSGPLLEKAMGVKAGIGFFGKNTSLIIPGYGSYFHLALILTTVRISYQPKEPIPSACLHCQLCIKACPQGALVGPYTLDARKCLAYLTVEFEEDILGLINQKPMKCFYGCDICQEVCPFNPPKRTLIALPQAERILYMSPKDFENIFGGSAFLRAGLARLKRNIEVCLKSLNQGRE